MASKAKRSVVVLVLVGLALLLLLWLPFEEMYTLDMFVISILVIFFMGFGYHLIRKRLKSYKEETILNELTTSDTSDNAEAIGNDGNKAHDLKLFDFDSIVEATDNFSDENKLGQGGFGPVFKGKLADGAEIAVKRLLMSSGQGLKEFKNELILIAKLQHTNLVRLLGCCVTKEEKMLIYEYMPNKSLDFFFFDAKRREEFDWKKRFNIIDGIAQGLLYLHRYSRLKIIHRDLKPGNILLDNDMNPKISDFGMARIFGRNEDQANTKRVVGTFGYMSPEYAMGGNFSKKSDVYSFGVLLLEIVSGMKITSSFFVSKEYSTNLVGYAWELWKEGKSMELIDSTLVHDESNKPQMRRCVQVGLLCIQDSALDRPAMCDVIPMIANQTMTLSDPNMPVAVRYKMKDQNASGSGRKQECFSANEASISEIGPR